MHTGEKNKKKEKEPNLKLKALAQDHGKVSE